ncbi:MULTISPECIES: helix-turn-helix transcriptional regulator [Phaeobacter]|uniref:helix-turn-helix domain-containing protein n=1 Tax=Phaeobacter TaxID=302485 RepID=UPI0006950A48|nr:MULTISPECIES: helix-turn-helix transcriptional regulator [Phaeobacter]AUQ89389.1 hypothetical protein PhaeoP24_00743 [Phaeobacter inhibens]
MTDERRELSQAEFAREMGVSRAAVSQWKSKDILKDSAFTKPGKKGKIIFAVAVNQVRQNRDIGQSLGNGIATRTTVDADPQAEAPTAPVSELEEVLELQPILPVPQPETAEGAPPVDDAPEVPLAAQPKPDSVEDMLKRAKLEQQLRTNRIQATEEAAQLGMLVAADDAREQLTRVAGMMMQIFEGALTDFAAALASQFDVPQRDVLHLLKSEFRNVRKTATMKQRVLAEGKPKRVETNLEIDA